MDIPYMGPTVEEFGHLRLAQIKEEIGALLDERASVLRRIAQYRGSKMLEAERVANAVEPFQTKPLSER